MLSLPLYNLGSFAHGIWLLVIREILLQPSFYIVENYTSAGCLQVFRGHEEKSAILGCNADYRKANI